MEGSLHVTPPERLKVLEARPQQHGPIPATFKSFFCWVRQQAFQSKIVLLYRSGVT